MARSDGWAISDCRSVEALNPGFFRQDEEYKLCVIIGMNSHLSHDFMLTKTGRELLEGIANRCANFKYKCELVVRNGKQ